MTTVLDTATSAGPAGSVSTTAGRQFVRAHRAAGRARVVAAVVAAGTIGGAPARLALPVERLATVDGKYLPTSAPFTVTLTAATESTQPLAWQAERAAAAVAADLGLTGSLTAALRLPGRNDGGADVVDAVTQASVDAVCAAAEQPVTPALRAVAVEAAGHGAVALPRDTVFGVHDPQTGAALTSWESFPRYYVVFVHWVTSAGGAASTDVTDAGHLELVPFTGDLGDEAAVARWLTAASAPNAQVNPVRDLLDAVHGTGEHPTLGVVGGHGPLDPVALLLPADHSSLVAGQRLHSFLARQLTERFGAQSPVAKWQVTGSRLAAG